MQRQWIADGSAISTAGGADVRARRRARGCVPVLNGWRSPDRWRGSMDGVCNRSKLTRHKTLATPSLLALHAPQEARKWRGTNSGVLVTVSFRSRQLFTMLQLSTRSSQEPATRPACCEHASASCCRRLPLAPLTPSPAQHASAPPRTGNVHSGSGLCDPTTTPARRREDN